MMEIGAFTRKYEVTARAVRLYEKLGLIIPELPHIKGAKRKYSEKDGKRIQQIKFLKKCGLTLKEIRNHLGKNSTTLLPLEIINEQMRLRELSIKENQEGLKLLGEMKVQHEGTG